MIFVKIKFSNKLMKTLIKLFSTILILSLSGCGKEESTPDPSSQIADKWWCAKTGTGSIASQYFKSDGTWEQGSKGGKFNDTGKWAFSSNKKKIVISNVLDYNKKSKTGWEYDIESYTDASLKMNWSAFNVKMDLEICK